MIFLRFFRLNEEKNCKSTIMDFGRSQSAMGGDFFFGVS